MYEKIKKVTIGEETFPMLFSLAALLEITDKYGDLSNITMNGKTLREKIGIVPDLLSVLINQGLMYEAGGAADARRVTPEWIAGIMTPGDIEPMFNAASDAMISGMGMLHKVDDGAPRDLVLEELNRGNAEAAAVK